MCRTKATPSTKEPPEPAPASRSADPAASNDLAGTPLPPNEIRRTIVHEESLPCVVPLDKLDMDWLQRQYSTLFDRAARAVFLQGLDLDDVIVERFLGVRWGGEDLRLELPSLNDAERIAFALSSELRGTNRQQLVARQRETTGRIAACANAQDSISEQKPISHADSTPARIERLTVVATLERW